MGAVKNFFQEIVDTYENDPNHKTQSIVDIHEALDYAIEGLLQKGYHAEDIGIVTLVISAKLQLADETYERRKNENR